ncbi:transaldolase [Leptolyngbya cf. ectocarpi LEGE 11479]|uniref:Transaldolase n=1 Tax=Leptolyngbya cf. ectocarpi LEGE 11479 TaxID=1828722 RepID=A0A928X3Z1_LEPEC|nr:transaldolase [Leptolyngbya cf. ectocarpi LEGE 11479]
MKYSATGDLSVNSTNLRLYLDTADIAAWETWLPTEIFYGVTCNPLLLEQAQVPCTLGSLTQLATTAFELGAQEVQLQAWGETKQALIATGQALAKIDPRVVVKVPITQLGTIAAAALIAADIRVTMTAVYEVPQILIAAALGADYAAPYLGRINDAGGNGRKALAQMQHVLNGVQSSTRILAASIRDVNDLAYLAAQGLDTFTFAPRIATALFASEQTAAATAAFEWAAEAMGDAAAED